eukprot:COSAG06_NODE_60825_length_269_cov_1.223529_1_plen_51_part_01
MALPLLLLLLTTTTTVAGAGAADDGLFRPGAAALRGATLNEDWPGAPAGLG